MNYTQMSTLELIGDWPSFIEYSGHILLMETAWPVMADKQYAKINARPYEAFGSKVIDGGRYVTVYRTNPIKLKNSELAFPPPVSLRDNARWHGTQSFNSDICGFMHDSLPRD